MDKMVKNVLENENELREKLLTMVEASYEDGNHAAGSFIEQFLSQKEFSLEMAEYIYSSDILSWMNDTILEDGKKLLNANADIGWFMLLQSASEEGRDLENICRNIMYAYSHGILLENMQEIYSNFSTVEALERDILRLLNNSEKNVPNKEKEDEEKGCSPEAPHGEQIILRELKKMQENLSRQIAPVSDGIAALASANKLRDKVHMLEKEVVKKRLQLENNERGLKKAELTIRLLKKEKETLQMHLNRSSNDSRITDLEDELTKSRQLKQSLHEEIQNLHEELQMVREENQSFKKDKEELERIICELKKQNQELSIRPETVYSQPDRIPEMAEEFESVEPRQEVTASFDSTSDSDINETGLFNELEWKAEDIKDIVPDKNGIINRIMKFAHTHSSYYERQYMKKTILEQENMLFVKMMELHFSKEKVLMVKNVLQTKKSLSRVELYKFLSKNPTEDELIKYSENAA